MTADLYRDANLGLRARVAELAGRIREREAEVTDAFWTSIDASVRARLAEHRESLDLVISDKELSFEELASAEGLLASYLEELELLISRLPAVEEEWRALPADVPDPPAPAKDLPGLTIPHHELRAAFTRAVRDRDLGATITADHPRSFLARFEDHGAPFALRATAEAHANAAEVSMWLVTSVPRAMPKLLVRHESLVMAFGKALGVKHEVEIGELSFDGLFLIESTPEAARRILTTNVRGMLLTLARYDVPTLEIDPPNRIASLKWRFEPNAKALDAALRVLASIRETNAPVQFRQI